MVSLVSACRVVARVRVVPDVASVVSVVVCRVVAEVASVSLSICVMNRLHREGGSLLVLLLAGRTVQALQSLGWAQVVQLSVLTVVSTYRLLASLARWWLMAM